MAENDNIVDYKILGEKIKNKRISLGLSQDKVSEELGISESFYSRIERGERSISIDTLVKISNFYKVSMDFLLLESKDISEHDSFQIEITNILTKKNPKQAQYILDLITVISENMDKLVP